MHLLEHASNLLQNTATTLFALPTPIEAFAEFPPPAMEDFWKLVEAAITVIERARRDELLTTQDQTQNLERLSELLTRALRLYRDVLRRAGVSQETLKRELEQYDVEPRQQKVLLHNYFRQVRGLAARITEYGQTVLDAYDKHPEAVMDVNALLDAIERFTKYRNSGGNRPDTSNIDTLYLLRTIAGEAHTWYDRTSPYSEFNMLSSPVSNSPDKWKNRGREYAETQQYLAWVWTGASAEDVAALSQWQKEAWAVDLNQKVKRPPDFSRFPHIQQDGEQSEIWFFINGVVTDHWIAQLNAEHLAYLFKRPIHILHNPTEGLHRDLRECVAGRVLEQRTGVAEDLREELSELAREKGRSRIVVVAHSQGTILSSDIVKELRRRESPLLRRMEVFNFAFCADEFPDGCCRHVEHYVNQNDLVSALSLVPVNLYDVPGPIFLRRNKWGHFLGAHYLDPEGLPSGAYKDKTGEYRPVLSSYIKGANYGVLAPRRPAHTERADRGERPPRGPS